MSRPILIRSFLAVLVFGAVVAVGSYLYEAHVRQDAAAAVRVAIDAHLDGQEWTHVQFLNDNLANNKTFDLGQFILDVKTGYEIKSGPKWLNVYDVEIHTTNGRRYAASPIWNTTHWTNGEVESYWSIACCERRN